MFYRPFGFCEEVDEYRKYKESEKLVREEVEKTGKHIKKKEFGQLVVAAIRIKQYAYKLSVDISADRQTEIQFGSCDYMNSISEEVARKYVAELIDAIS